MLKLLEAIPVRGAVSLDVLRGQVEEVEPVLSQLEKWRLVSVERRDGQVAVARTVDAADYLRCLKSRCRPPGRRL